MFHTGFVNLYTNDIEASLHFYGELIGMRETFRTPREGVPEHVELSLDGFMIGLGTVEAARRVHGVVATPGRPASVIVLWCEDVDKAFDLLQAHGVASQMTPHDSGNNNRSALVMDPDGNLVEIVSKS